MDRLRSLDLRFIPSKEFRTLTAAKLESQTPEQIYQTEADGLEDSSLGSRLLTAAGERHLFRLWNFLKCSAHRLMQQGKERATLKIVQEVEQLWTQAQGVRSQIVNANVRLVVALAHKFASTPEEVDEFISEGNLILVNAVDKFDYSRGFRFSTYATHAVQRHFFRLTLRRQRRKQREVLSPIEFLANQSIPEIEDASFNPQIAHELIRRFDDCLNSRERAILEHRFGLKGKSSATLKTIAEQVGLSKERVRQLQMTAIEKLQNLAVQLRLHPETCL